MTRRFSSTKKLSVRYRSLLMRLFYLGIHSNIFRPTLNPQTKILPTPLI